MTLLCHAQALSLDQVVAAIYETVIRPEQFDRFFQPPPSERAVTLRRGGTATGARDRGTQLLQSHFARAAEIHEGQWQQANRQHPGSYKGVCSRFWLLVDAGSGGRLINASQGAARQLSGGAELIDAMGLTAASSNRWRNFLRQVHQGAVSGQEVLLLETGTAAEYILCRPVLTSRSGGAARSVMAERLELEWDSAAAVQVASVIGATADELAPLEKASAEGALVAGGVTDLASRLGAPDVAALVRLAAFLMTEHVRDLKVARGEVLPPASTLVERNGRRSQYFRLGAETGQPVIFVHGILDGIAPLQRLQPQLRQLGFRVFAPMRGGYGSSDPLAPGEDPVEACVRQLDALIATEGLQKPILLSHRAGALFACTAASRLHRKIPALLAVAANCNASSPRQFSGIRGYAWLVAFCAGRAPWLLPVLLKGWATAIRWYGHEILLRAQTAPGSRERARLDALHLLPLLKQSQDLFLNRGGAGCLADVRVMRRGFAHMGLGQKTRAVFVHGGEDQVAPLPQIREALRGMGNAQLCVSQEAGASLFYTFPELVLTALQDCAAAASD